MTELTSANSARLKPGAWLRTSQMKIITTVFFQSFSIKRKATCEVTPKKIFVLKEWWFWCGDDAKYIIRLFHLFSCCFPHYYWFFFLLAFASWHKSFLLNWICESHILERSASVRAGEHVGRLCPLCHTWLRSVLSWGIFAYEFQRIHNRQTSVDRRTKKKGKWKIFRLWKVPNEIFFVVLFGRRKSGNLALWFMWQDNGY